MSTMYETSGPSTLEVSCENLGCDEYGYPVTVHGFSTNGQFDPNNEDDFECRECRGDLK